MWASTDSIADDTTDAPEQSARLLVFAVGGRACACRLDAVREIVPCRRTTRLPGAPSYVTGLINLRGTILTVMDLGLRLGGPAVDGVRGSIILVESDNRVVGLGVDELRDVQRTPPDAIEPADEGIGDGLVHGVLRIGSDVTILLDVPALVRQTLQHV